MSASTLGLRVRKGLRHRLLCGGLILVCLPIFVFNFLADGAAVSGLPILACLLLSTLGFLAPLILTEGFNRPMPSSRHLALLSPRVQWTLALAAALLIMAPALQRLLGAA